MHPLNVPLKKVTALRLCSVSIVNDCQLQVKRLQYFLKPPFEVTLNIENIGDLVQYGVVRALSSAAQFRLLKC